MSQPEDRRGIERWDRWLNVSVEELELSCSIVRRLSKAGILTIGQLASTTENDLNRLYWFGRGSIAKVNWALAQIGLPQIPKYIARSDLHKHS